MAVELGLSAGSNSPIVGRKHEPSFRPLHRRPRGGPRGWLGLRRSAGCFGRRAAPCGGFRRGSRRTRAGADPGRRHLGGRPRHERLSVANARGGRSGPGVRGRRCPSRRRTRPGAGHLRWRFLRARATARPRPGPGLRDGSLLERCWPRRFRGRGSADLRAPPWFRRHAGPRAARLRLEPEPQGLRGPAERPLGLQVSRRPAPTGPRLRRRGAAARPADRRKPPLDATGARSLRGGGGAGLAVLRSRLDPALGAQLLPAHADRGPTGRTLDRIPVLDRRLRRAGAPRLPAGEPSALGEIR